MTIDDAVRARGGEFRSLTFEGALRTASLKNYGFSMPVEYADMKEDANLDREATDTLVEFTDTVELLWAHSTLEALAIEQEISISATPDIDAAIKQALSDSAAETRVSVNRIFFGGSAWTTRYKVYRENAFKVGNNIAGKTPQEVSDDLMAEIRVGDPRKLNALGAMPLLQSNEILAFYAIPGATRYDATNVKFFEANGLNGHGTEVYESTSYQGTIKHKTVSRFGMPVVGNGFGVLKFKLVD